MLVNLTLNGARLEEDVRPDMTLFDFCRAHGYKSVKCACETSNCGLCTVLLDGEPVLSCSVLMARVDGREVTTLEGMRDGRRELLAQCLAEEGAEQCGFCAPGLEMAVLALDAAHPGADDETMRRYLSGNLCRCSGYASQMRAIRRFLARHANGGELPPREVPADATTESGAQHREIARPVAKKDSGALLAGAPVYTADLAPEGALVVKLVRSRHANAIVTDVDKSRALEVPGVVAVFGPDDVPHNRFTLAGQSFPEPSPYDTVLLDRHVRYVGDEVAMVVAKTEAAAAAGVRAVKVTYEQLPAIVDVEEALDNATVIHDEDDWTPGGDRSGDPAPQPRGARRARPRGPGGRLRRLRRGARAHLSHAGHAAVHDGDVPLLRLHRRLWPPHRGELHAGALPHPPPGGKRPRDPQAPGSRHQAARGRGLWRQAERLQRALCRVRRDEDRPPVRVHLHARGDHELLQHAPRDGPQGPHGRAARRHDRAPSTSTRSPTPAPTAITAPPRSRSWAARRCPSTTTPRRAASPTTWSTPTPRQAEPTAATARRRAASPWSPPSTSWPTSSAWTRASCASRTS